MYHGFLMSIKICKQDKLHILSPSRGINLDSLRHFVYEKYNIV